MSEYKFLVPSFSSCCMRRTRHLHSCSTAAWLDSCSSWVGDAAKSFRDGSYTTCRQEGESSADKMRMQQRTAETGSSSPRYWGESADWWRRTNGSVSDVSGEDPPSSPGGADTDTRHVFRPPPPPSPWCDQISRMNQIYAGNRVGAVQFKNYAMQCLV